MHHNKQVTKEYSGGINRKFWEDTGLNIFDKKKILQFSLFPFTNVFIDKKKKYIVFFNKNSVIFSAKKRKFGVKKNWINKSDEIRNKKVFFL